MASNVSRLGFRAVEQPKLLDDKVDEEIAKDVAVKILNLQGKAVSSKSLTLDNLLEAETIVCAPGTPYHVVNDIAIFERFSVLEFKHIIRGENSQGEPIYIISETARHALHLTIYNRIQHLPSSDKLSAMTISMKNLGYHQERILNQRETVTLRAPVAREPALQNDQRLLRQTFQTCHLL